MSNRCHRCRDRVQESDRISDAILEIETVNVRLECLSEVIDLLDDVGMIVRKFLEHADHVVLVSIHEALGVHLGFTHRKAGLMDGSLCWCCGNGHS